MSVKTEIAWCDSTWSPIRARVKLDATAIALKKGYTSLVQIAERMAGRVGQHCEHVSPGCEHCYAETNNHRCLPGNGTGLPYDRRSRDLVEAFVDEKVLLQPLKWRAIRQYDPDDGERYADRPRRIFVENQSDLFGEWVTDEMLNQVFTVMALCPQHIFQVLTKRPERMLAYWADERKRTLAIINQMADICYPGFDPGGVRLPLPNVWKGVSVEDQAAADKRIPVLLQTPAAVRFISAEPLLGSVMLDLPPIRFNERELDWVICGGESGPGARPMHADWARSLRDQCVAAGVPFFFKQIMVDKKVQKLPYLDGKQWKEFPCQGESGEQRR